MERIEGKGGKEGLSLPFHVFSPHPFLSLLSISVYRREEKMKSGVVTFPPSPFPPFRRCGKSRVPCPPFPPLSPTPPLFFSFFFLSRFLAVVERMTKAAAEGPPFFPPSFFLPFPSVPALAPDGPDSTPFFSFFSLLLMRRKREERTVLLILSLPPLSFPLFSY